MTRYLNKRVILLSCFYVMSVSILSADTPSNEELLQLEQQIKQQEAELEKEKQRKAEEARRRAEEQKLREERARLEEERRKLEEERKRVEENERKQREAAHARQAEQAKQEKFNALVTEGESALRNKDKTLAIEKFNAALALYPGNSDVEMKIRQAEKLKHKVCYDVLGWWINTYVYTIEFKLNEDGGSESNLSRHPTWKCTNPEDREIVIDGIGDVPPDNIYQLSANGDCLCRKHAPEDRKRTCSIKGSACYLRK